MKTNLTEGSVRKKLLVFALPIMLGMMLQTAYNIIDMAFVGMLGADELAAVSLTYPVIFIFIAFAAGLGIGANALLSRAIGKKDYHEANNLAEHAIFIAVFVGITVAALGILFSAPLFEFMGAKGTLLPLTLEYSNAIFIGLIFMFLWFVSDSILKAEGNSRIPLITLGISVLLNVVLDPLLIFGIGPFPRMGLLGAAVATVIARIVAALINFIYIYSPGSAINLALRDFKLRSEYIKRMLEIGLPASGSQVLSSAGFVLLMSVVGSFGSYAIAAYGIGLRINSIIIMPLVGINSAIITFVGQNIGAKQIERAKRVNYYAFQITVPLTLLLSSLLFLFPEFFFSIFSQEAEILAIGRSYLLIMPIAYVLYSVYFVFLGAIQGAGKTKIPLVTNIVHWILAVILALILSPMFGLAGVWIAMVIATVVEMLLLAGVFFSGKWLEGVY